MVVRDKLENSGGLAWRRLEQGQLPELPCIGPAFAAAEADPWHGAATCPCPVLALGISFTSPGMCGGRVGRRSMLASIACHIRFAGGVRQIRCMIAFL